MFQITLFFNKTQPIITEQNSSIISTKTNGKKGKIQRIDNNKILIPN